MTSPFELSRSELNKVVPVIRKYYRYFDTSSLRAFFDVMEGMEDSVVEIVPRRYYFHLPTGWLLTLEPDFYGCKRTFLVECNKLYLRTMLNLLKERSKPETVKRRIKFWMRKLGYRYIFCLRKTVINKRHTELLTVHRHVSVPLYAATSLQTKEALIKAKNVAKQKGLSYPHLYKLDKLLLRAILINDHRYFIFVRKKLEKLFEDLKLGKPNPLIWRG